MELDNIQLLVFSLQINETICEYGVSINQVQGIERLPEITGLPQTDSFIKGIINLRNEVIPLIDLKKLFELGETEYNNDTRIIIFDIDARKSGIIVDEVQEVIYVNKSQIEYNVGFVSGISSRYINGVAKVDNKLIVIIDLARIININQQKELNAITN